MTPLSARSLALSNPSRQLALLLAAAVLFGGGGVGSAVTNLAVQLVALALLAANREAVARLVHEAPRGLVLLLLASLALPLIQLVPLPPALWTALPGRELVVGAVALTGGEAPWLPASVSRAATLVAFLGLLAPLCVVSLGWAVSRSRLMRLQVFVVALGLGCAGLGMIQIIGGDILIPYPENPMPGVLFGTFGNCNSTGLFMACCLLLLVSLPQDAWSGPRLAVAGGSGLVLALAVILTQSRSAMVLLALPALLLAARLIAAHRCRSGLTGRRPSAARTAILALIACGLLAGAATAVLNSGRIETSLARFDEGDGARAEMREDARVSAQRFWPLGAGMGTFDDVFQVDESLQYVSVRTAGRAHNDYLELAIEAGLPGLVLAGSWALWLMLGVVRSARGPAGWPAAGGGAVLLAVAFQSLVDYPLRNQTMLCLSAFAILLVARFAAPARDGPA